MWLANWSLSYLSTNELLPLYMCSSGVADENRTSVYGGRAGVVTGVFFSSKEQQKKNFINAGGIILKGGVLEVPGQ